MCKWEIREAELCGGNLINYFAIKDKQRTLEFEEYLKSHSGKAFAKKRLW